MVCCPQCKASKKRQSGSLPHSVHAMMHSSAGCFTNSSCPVARARSCGLEFDALDSQSTVRPSRVGGQKSEVLPGGDSADIVCELGRGIGLFGLRWDSNLQPFG